MKRTNFVTKLISFILFVFMAIYMGVYLFQSLTNSMTTALAITLPAEESFSVSGIIIREETVINVSGSIVASNVQEGEKVSAGQAYLVTYSSEEARETDVRRNQLQQEIEQMEIYMGSSGTLDQAASMESEIKKQIQELNYATSGGGLSELEERTITLRALVFSGDETGTSLRLESLRQELASLEASSGSTGVIEATQSGVYSTKVDGFEDLSPDDLESLDAESLKKLTEESREGLATSAGKLVTNATWYYGATVGADELEPLSQMLNGEVKNQVTLVFSGLNTVNVKMKVYSINTEEDGSAVVVFSSGTCLTETLALRQTEAKVVLSTVEGLRVPKGAIYWEEEDAETGETPVYLYTLTAGTAEKKYVKIIFESEDYYLVVADYDRTSDAASLREGNTIIVNGKNLYDGKVVS